MSSESRQFWNCFFGRGGTRVAQPLGHRWLYSVTESRRTTFSETASVRTTWDSSPAGSCPGAVDERLFFLGSNFSSERMTSDSSPADSCSDMVYEGRVLFCSMVSSVWTTSCQIPAFFGPDRVHEWRVLFCSIFSLGPYSSMRTFGAGQYHCTSRPSPQIVPDWFS
jgi:hypothetical protein